MAGWNLKEGACTNFSATDQELWDALIHLLTTTHKTTTYKFCFLKSLLDVVSKDQSLTLDFKTIFKRFANIYWELIVNYDLCQVYENSSFSKSKVEQIIEQTIDLDPDYKKPFIHDLPLDVQEKLYSDIQKYCSRNVVGAFFESTNGLFYSFSKKDKKVRLSPRALEFMVQYFIAIEELNYYNWAKMIEKINGDKTPKSLVTKMSKLGTVDALHSSLPVITQKYRLEDILPWSFNTQEVNISDRIT